MIYNFAINTMNDSTVFGLCTASDEDEAMDILTDMTGYASDRIDIQPGAEAMINQQYGGIAFLSTDSYDL